MYDAADRLANKLRQKLTIIQPFLDDESVTDIMLNPDCRIWIDRLTEGITETDIYIEPSQAMLIIGGVADFNGKIVNADNSILHGILPDGERFEAVIPPSTPDVPVWTIRCPRSASFKLEDYVSTGRMPEYVAGYIRKAITYKKNIIISGGTGSGKTTLTNAILSELNITSPDDRILVLEDTREINIDMKNKVFYTSTEKQNMTKLLAACLRSRPDRIILGEIRGAEALDLLKSWNTGHPGGISTVHANSALSALARFETLILEANGNLNINFIRSLIADAVDCVIQIQREKKTGPRLSEIIEVKSIDVHGNYVTQPVYSIHDTKNNSATEEMIFSKYYKSIKEQMGL